MKKISHSFFVLLFAIEFTTTYAQVNLVVNPSFEQYSTCPTGNSQQSEIGCSSYRETPDYYNACSLSSANVPYACCPGVFQYASSGNAYIGLYSYYPATTDEREVVGCQLLSSLQIGTRYFVSFQTNLAAIDSNLGFNAASDHLGVLFTTDTFSVSNPIAMNKNFAHVFSSVIISDTLNWTRVFGSFIADSSYKYMAVGNFFDSASINVTHFSSCTSCYSAAYYFVDDICVSTDSVFTSTYAWTGIDQHQLSDFNLYPNPSQGRVYIEISTFLGNKTEVHVTDVCGKEIKLISVTTPQIEFDIKELGVYFVTVINGQEQMTKKVILLSND